MGGGLLQLVAYGAQDVYLTGNPQITFFKVVYRRHTNFALESIQQTFNGSVSFGQRVTATISRNGDLISRAYLVMSCETDHHSDNTLASSKIAVPYLGLRAIKTAEVEIGGQKIDKHYSDWMYIWNELSLPVGKKEGYYKMVGGAGGVVSGKMYVPLEFWFCRNIGLALPLIALQYHEVKLTIEFASGGNCAVYGSDDLTGLKAELWIDYIYLDTDERRKFAQSSHEYLIEQLQFTGKESVPNNKAKVKLNFNHPVKELVWVGHGMSTNKCWMNYTNDVTGVTELYDISATGDSNDPKNIISSYEDIAKKFGPNSGETNRVSSAKLILNGNDRFYARDGDYFNLVQPFQHHENIPNNRGINVYSFALKPEEHQPSGTLNMSRIDTATLDLEFSDAKVSELSIYAVNYNVLRILSGMGGIAYSN
jgi:hypothetical protein